MVGSRPWCAPCHAHAGHCGLCWWGFVPVLQADTAGRTITPVGPHGRGWQRQGVERWGGSGFAVVLPALSSYLLMALDKLSGMCLAGSRYQPKRPSAWVRCLGPDTRE